MSRIDTIKEQNPELNVSLIDIISMGDPSDTNKFIGLLMKFLKAGDNKPDKIKKHVLNSLFGENRIKMLKKFNDHLNSNRIKNNDISTYKSFGDVEKAVKEGDEVVKQKELEKQVIKLHDEKDLTVLIPLTYEASRTYGSKTKWCITEESAWIEYFGVYKLIFIIDKANKTKYAVSFEYDDITKVSAWNAEDDEMSPMFLPEKAIPIIAKELNKKLFQTEYEYLGDDKIVTQSLGIVNISEATYDDIEIFNEHFCDRPNSFIPDSLKNKLHDRLCEFDNEVSTRKSKKSDY